MQPSVAARQASAPPPVVSQRVAQMRPDGAAVRCVLSDERSLTLSRFLTSFIRPSDQLEFDPTAADPIRELRVVQSTTRRPRELYFVPIAYVTQPKPDKRGEYFVRAEITDSRLGIRHVYLPNQRFAITSISAIAGAPVAKSRLCTTCCAWCPRRHLRISGWLSKCGSSSFRPILHPKTRPKQSNAPSISSRIRISAPAIR